MARKVRVRSKHPELLSALNTLKDKAGNIYVTGDSEKILPMLKKYLNHTEYVELIIAYNKFTLDESKTELEENCNNLIKKYAY